MIEPDWPTPPGVEAASTERTGGVSAGPFASLNLGDHVGDRPEHVQANRGALVRTLGLPGEPCWLEQVHGMRVLDLDREAPGTADGAVSSTPGQVCAILTADCLPVLLAAREGGRIGAVHAGWRGTAADIAGGAVARAGESGISPDSIQVELGPSIGRCCYEVGEEVLDAFSGSGLLDRETLQEVAGTKRLDLRALNARLLERAGVRRESIRQSDHCTRCGHREYFSYRWDPSDVGRQSSWVGWVNPIR